MPPQYKFVEVSPVTAETLEAAVNEWVGQGWQLDGVRFVVTEHSKRPQMAFVSFVTDRPGPATAATDGGAPAEPPMLPEDRPRPLEVPEQPARVITAPQGDDVD